jgi:Protein of unknown function, DUF547
MIMFFTVLCITYNLAAGQPITNDVEQFFNHVRIGDQRSAAKVVKKLAGVNKDQLKKELDSENKSKAFWINVYNTFAQYLLKDKPALYDDRNDFFGEELITVAGQELSLDDIEHGIIRRSKNKYSMGYVGKFYVGDFEKQFRLEKTDYRIHFALNCGAKSCPPVALYQANRIDEQLDKSTTAYLKANTKFDEEEDEVLVPKLCSWFKADFGGEDGVIDMLHKYKIIPNDKNPDVEYLDYNWELSLSNYIDL